MSRGRWSRSQGSSQWSAWRWETYRQVGALDAGNKVVIQLVVARKREPGREERRLEPRVAEDRAAVGLDQDAGVPERRGGDHAAANLPAGAPQAGRRQATGGSVYCWPARETCSVQAEPSQ